MKRFALPLALALSLAAQSAAASTALLRTNVVVDGDVVKLGDLFDNVGAKADVAIARSPSPGRRATVDADWLQRVANLNGVEWKPDNVFEQAVIERSGVAVTHDQIEAAVVSALAGQGVSADSQVELANKTLQVIIPVGSSDQIAVHELIYDAHYKRFSAMIEVPANSPTSSRVRVSGRVIGTVDIPVLGHQLNHGEVITARDITWTKMREDALRRDVVTDADQMIGLTPRMQVRPGLMVSNSELEKPVAVTRGALVTMVLKSGAMALTAQGHAVEQGSIGDVIHVTNTKSNMTVEGRIEGPNMVSVSPNGTTALAN